MRLRTWLAGLGAAALAALLAVYYVVDGHARLCEAMGGRWAMAKEVCYTRGCYAEGDCGYWSNPAARCGLLKPGDPVAEVYFQLGRPDHAQGAHYAWRARKGYGIDATLENGRLTALDCMVGTPGP